MLFNTFWWNPAFKTILLSSNIVIILCTDANTLNLRLLQSMIDLRFKSTLLQIALIDTISSLKFNLLDLLHSVLIPDLISVLYGWGSSIKLIIFFLLTWKPLNFLIFNCQFWLKSSFLKFILYKLNLSFLALILHFLTILFGELVESIAPNFRGCCISIDIILILIWWNACCW